MCATQLCKFLSGRDPTILLGGAAGATVAGFGLEGLHAAWVLTAFGLEELEAAVRCIALLTFQAELNRAMEAALC